MGAFFTNVHVHVGDRPAESIVGAVLEALRTRVPGSGPWKLVDEGAVADRVILVTHAPGSPWVTLYDQLTESQRDAALDGVGTLLSDAVGTPALAVVVHDSDVLRLRLYEHGALAASYDSSPDDFGSVHRPSSPPPAWAHVLRAGVELGALARELDEPRTFAEQRLDGVARVLGLDAHLCQRGLHLLMRDSLPPECVRLAFVRTDVEQQPPALAFPDAPHPQERVFAGEPVHLSVGALSTGGPGVGLGVAVWGSALDGKLLDLGAVSVHVHTANDRQRVQAPLEKHRAQGQEAHGVELVELRIPGRGVDGDSPEAWAGAHLGVTLQGVAADTGEGTLHVRLTPLANPQGAARWSIPLVVERAPRRPLHASPDVDMELLHLMEVPRTLFALVTLEGDARTCAESAAHAMAAWNQALAAHHTGTYVTELIPDGRFHPRSGTLPARGLEQNRKWAEIQAQLDGCALFQASLVVSSVPERASRETRMGPGFAFSRSLPILVDGGGVPAAFLGLWTDIDVLAPDAREGMRRALVEIVDGLCAQGRVTQAALAAWDWLPSLPADPTPYELACGQHGAPVGTRAHVETALRLVGDAVWLGPALAARLGRPDMLEAAASVAALGEGLRVLRRGGASLTDLERALAVLLARAPGYGA